MSTCKLQLLLFYLKNRNNLLTRCALPNTGILRCQQELDGEWCDAEDYWQLSS